MFRLALALLVFAAAANTQSASLYATDLFDNGRSIETTITLHQAVMSLNTIEDGKRTKRKFKTSSMKIRVPSDAIVIRFHSRGRCAISVADVELSSDAVVVGEQPHRTITLTGNVTMRIDGHTTAANTCTVELGPATPSIYDLAPRSSIDLLAGN